MQNLDLTISYKKLLQVITCNTICWPKKGSDMNFLFWSEQIIYELSLV
jgi:hypothetical protein